MFDLDRPPPLADAMHLKPDQKIILAQAVGFPGAPKGPAQKAKWTALFMVMQPPTSVRRFLAPVSKSGSTDVGGPDADGEGFRYRELQAVAPTLYSVIVRIVYSNSLDLNLLTHRRLPAGCHIIIDSMWNNLHLPFAIVLS